MRNCAARESWRRKGKYDAMHAIVSRIHDMIYQPAGANFLCCVVLCCVVLCCVVLCCAVLCCVVLWSVVLDLYSLSFAVSMTNTLHQLIPFFTCVCMCVFIYLRLCICFVWIQVWEKRRLGPWQERRAPCGGIGEGTEQNSVRTWEQRTLSRLQHTGPQQDLCLIPACIGPDEYHYTITPRNQQQTWSKRAGRSCRPLRTKSAHPISRGSLIRWPTWF